MTFEAAFAFEGRIRPIRQISVDGCTVVRHTRQSCETYRDFPFQMSIELFNAYHLFYNLGKFVHLRSLACTLGQRTCAITSRFEIVDISE